MSNSDVVIAPQKGNALGATSIEVLALKGMSAVWHVFAHAVCNKGQHRCSRLVRTWFLCRVGLKSDTN